MAALANLFRQVDELERLKQEVPSARTPRTAQAITTGDATP